MIKDIVKPRNRGEQKPNIPAKNEDAKPIADNTVCGEGFTFRPDVLTRSQQTMFDRVKWREELEERRNLDTGARLDFFSTAGGNRITRIRPERGEKKLTVPPLKNPPAVVYSAEELVFGKDTDEGLTERQIRWKHNIVTTTSIREKSEDVVKSKNPLGWGKYIFTNAVIASKNGMLYYLIPLVIDIAFLISNFARYAFMTNMGAAMYTLIAFLAARTLLKNRDVGTLGKTIGSVFITSVYVAGLYCVYRFLPDTWNDIRFGFTAKLFFMAFCFVHFATFYTYFALSYAQDVARAEDNNCVVECKAGDPGCGKTSQAVQEVYVMALMKWRQLQTDFWSWHSREKDIIKRNDRDELLDYHEIKASYGYYIMRSCIPCLWSNIPITDSNGRTCSKISLDHIRGVERLPAYSVVLFDEIGAVLKCELSNSKKEYYDVSDMFRLGRHFLKWSVICCEQDYNNIYIDCRRVMGTNTVISYQEWVCKPVIALGIYKFLELLISDTLDKKVSRRPFMARFMAKFRKFTYGIGFRRQVYRHARNTETGSPKKGIREKEEKLSGAKVRYIPSKVIASYDDRAYRQDYAAYYDKEICGELFKRDDADITYKRQFVGETDILAEKRKATDGRIRKVG